MERVSASCHGRAGVMAEMMPSIVSNGADDVRYHGKTQAEKIVCLDLDKSNSIMFAYSDGG